MANKFLDDNGLRYLWTKITTAFVAKETGKTLTDNNYTDAEKASVAANVTARHTHTNKTTLDATTAAYTTAEKTKLGTLNNYTLPTASATVLGGVKVGSNLSITNGVLSATDTNTTYGVATSSANGLMSAADFAKLAAFGSASTYALKSDITGLYKYRGQVDTVADLPSTAATGDVYDVASNGGNYAWNGTAWDSLGGTFTVTAITNAEIDTIVA